MRGCCFPVCDVVESAVIFEGVELDVEELAVADRAIPCGEVWWWDAHCRR